MHRDIPPELLQQTVTVELPLGVVLRIAGDDAGHGSG